MPIRFYDTLARSRIDFKPLEDGKVGIYVCGPTVYNFIHIGNARTFLAFDVVVRHLRARGFSVRYVRNITDVDDKIIRRAQSEQVEPTQLADRFVDEFHRDMETLGLVTPDVEPRVTTHMQDILNLVSQLIARELAYVVDGDVYYAPRLFAAYGQLSGRKLDELQSGARVEIDERKRDPLDFALWKAAKPGEPAWDSPWGPGRPGWHIECSAMSSRLLGPRFDIHGGGPDLVFPHHENEIAQSQGALGEGTFARHWLHAGFLNLNQEKMSKSLGNIFTVREIVERHDAEALRMYLLGTQYRHPINFEVVPGADDEVRFPGLEEAESRTDYFYETLLRLEEQVTATESRGSVTDGVFEALDDDFNTAQALAVLGERMAEANRLLDARTRDRAVLGSLLAQLRACGAVLGLLRQDPAARQQKRRDAQAARLGIELAAVEARIAERTKARQARDFARADAVRLELSNMGVELRDGPKGTSWRLKPLSQQPS